MLSEDELPPVLPPDDPDEPVDPPELALDELLPELLLEEGFLEDDELDFLEELEDVLAGCSVTSSSTTSTCSLLACAWAR